jgi:hypothetical protein
MMTKITLALALALAAVTTTLPAAAQEAACSGGAYAAICWNGKLSDAQLPMMAGQ